MNYGATLTYESGGERLVFYSHKNDMRKGDFWLSDAPNLSGVDVDTGESQTMGQIGTTVNAQAVKAKTLIFTGTIVRNIAPARARLLRAVSPQKTARVVYTFGGKSWYLEGVPTQTPLVTAGEYMQPFQFQFRAPYPYWRDAQELRTSIAGLNKQFKFPFNTGGAWYISTFSDSFYTSITNGGNVAIGIRISIDAAGEVTNPRVDSFKTGQTIAFNRVFENGEYANVYTEYGKRGVELFSLANGLENGFRYLTAGSDITMSLEPGENIFRFHAEAGRELARVSIIAPKNGVVSGV